jgi:hypothetical protein
MMEMIIDAPREIARITAFVPIISGIDRFTAARAVLPTPLATMIPSDTKYACHY